MDTKSVKKSPIKTLYKTLYLNSDIFQENKLRREKFFKEKIGLPRWISDFKFKIINRKDEPLIRSKLIYLRVKLKRTYLTEEIIYSTCRIFPVTSNLIKREDLQNILLEPKIKKHIFSKILDIINYLRYKPSKKDYRYLLLNPYPTLFKSSNVDLYYKPEDLYIDLLEYFKGLLEAYELFGCDPEDVNINIVQLRDKIKDKK